MNLSEGLDNKIDLRFQEPFDWDGILAFLRYRAVPGLELADHTTYTRSVSLESGSDLISIRKEPTSSALRLSAGSTSTKTTPFLINKIRRLFDLDANPNGFFGSLSKTPALVEAIPELKSIRLPGSWDLFELGIRAILGQQITVAGAKTLSQRLISQFGQQWNPDSSCSHCFPTPEKLATSPVEIIGMPLKRADAIRAFSSLMLDTGTEAIEPETFSSSLPRIPGIGPWTVNYIRMRGLKDPDAFPIRDVALLKAARLLGIANSHTELNVLAETWRPYRSYATIALWKTLSKSP
jgi:AraC family transcriptional regulator, regulatory protein of adaptative response / DNA-3-methyladenine glycosylase II